MEKTKIPKDFQHIYDRSTCQKCKKPISKARIANCKKRKFWPICKECEKIVIPIFKKATEMLAKGQANWFK